MNIQVFVMYCWDGLVRSGVSDLAFWFGMLIQGMHRLKEKLHSGKILVPSDQWPIFVYAGQIFDREDPWRGLFRSKIMVQVTTALLWCQPHTDEPSEGLQTCFYIP